MNAYEGWRHRNREHRAESLFADYGGNAGYCGVAYMLPEEGNVGTGREEIRFQGRKCCKIIRTLIYQPFAIFLSSGKSLFFVLGIQYFI